MGFGLGLGFGFGLGLGFGFGFGLGLGLGFGLGLGLGLGFGCDLVGALDAAQRRRPLPLAGGLPLAAAVGVVPRRLAPHALRLAVLCAVLVGLHRLDVGLAPGGVTVAALCLPPG